MTHKTEWSFGPLESWAEASQAVAVALKNSGIELEVLVPNLPAIAPDDEAKRLKKKAREENPEHEWRGDVILMLADKTSIVAAATLMRDEMGYNMLYDLTAVDPSGESEFLFGVWGFLNVETGARVMLKTQIAKDDLTIDSLVAIHPAADWHEREAAEMFGLTYVGHPDPRNMLLPEDWAGHPLRKDYEYPAEYKGVSCE
jgi:NADH:ubiquinone oxidoreductase subunit C